MFLFKKKKIVVDCFIDNELIANYQPIRKSSHFIPEWWKNLSHTITVKNEKTGMEFERGTMRGCAGLIDLYAQGMMIPMWSDLKVRIDETKYTYQFALNDCDITHHPAEQHNNSFKGRLNIKMMSPWMLKEKTGVKFLYTGCTWTTMRLFPELIIVPGVLNFKYQIATHINSFVPVGNPPYEISVEAGTPMVQLIPLTEQKVEPRIQLVSDAEYKRICKNEWHNKFVKAYFNKINPKTPT